MIYDTDYDRHLEPPECSDVDCPACDGTGKQSGNDIPHFCFWCRGAGEVDRGLAVRIKKELMEAKQNY